MSLKEHPHWKSALWICDRLRKAGFIALLAGGCVRDHLLDRVANDLDIATNATPDQIEALFEKTIPTGKQFGVIRVAADPTVSNEILEVATFRSDGAYVDGRRPVAVKFSDRKEDALRRDFTINAMFMDPLTGKIYDDVGGQRDLALRELKAVGDAVVRFEEDHLRVLRAVRFVSQLGFRVEAQTFSAILAGAAQVASVSGERIQDEMKKLWSGESLELTRALFIKSNLFKSILGLDDVQNKNITQALSSVLGDRLFDPRLQLQPLDRWVLFAHLCPGLRSLLPPRLKWSREDKSIFERALSGFNDLPGFAHFENGALLKFRDRPEGALIQRLSKALAPDDPIKRQLLMRLEALALRWPLTPHAVIDGNDLIIAGVPPGPEFAKMLERAYDLQIDHEDLTKAELLNLILA